MQNLWKVIQQEISIRTTVKVPESSMLAAGEGSASSRADVKFTATLDVIASTLHAGEDGQMKAYPRLRARLVGCP